MKSQVLFLSFFIATGAFAQKGANTSSDAPGTLGSLMSSHPRYTREMVLGNILKGALENMHLSNKQINKNLSEEAFKLYLERLDYGKQFLIQSDVKELEAFKRKFDEMLISGDLTILDKRSELMNKRIGQIEKHIETLLAKPMDYNKKESIETDPKKRTFLKSEKELFDHWQKLMKFEVLSRIVDLEEEQNGLATDAKGNKKKPKTEKKLTSAEIEKEARDKVLK